MNRKLPTQVLSGVHYKNFGIFYCIESIILWTLTKKGLYYFKKFLLQLMKCFDTYDLEDLSIQFCKLYCIYESTCHRRKFTLKAINTKHCLKQGELKYILWSISLVTTHANPFISFGGCILNYRSGSVLPNIPSLKETYGNSQRRKQSFQSYPSPA